MTKKVKIIIIWISKNIYDNDWGVEKVKGLNFVQAQDSSLTDIQENSISKMKSILRDWAKEINKSNELNFKVKIKKIIVMKQHKEK